MPIFMCNSTLILEISKKSNFIKKVFALSTPPFPLQQLHTTTQDSERKGKLLRGHHGGQNARF